MKLTHLAKRHLNIFRDPDKGGKEGTGDAPAGDAAPAATEGGLASRFAKLRGDEPVQVEKGDEDAKKAKDDTKAKDKEEPKKNEEKKTEKAKVELPKGADVPEGVLAPKKEKVDDKPLDPSDEPPAHLSPKGKDDWRAYKAKKEAEYQALHEKYTVLEKELNDTKPKVWKDEEFAEYQRFKKEYPEMEQIIERIGLERSPQFQTKFVKGRAEIIEKAAKKVIAAGGDGKAFREAMGLTGKAKYEAIEEALGDAPQGVTGQVHSLVTQIEDLDEQREATLANGKTAMEEWANTENEKKRGELEKQQKQQTARFDEITELLADEFFVLKEAEGNDKWNEMSRGVRQRAKDFLFKASSFDDFATAAIAAESAPIFKQMYYAERNARMAAVEELERLAGAEPGLKNGGDGAKDDADAKPKTLADRVMAEMSA